MNSSALYKRVCIIFFNVQENTKLDKLMSDILFLSAQRMPFSVKEAQKVPRSNE